MRKVFDEEFERKLQEELEFKKQMKEWRKENKKEKKLVDWIYGLTLEQIKKIRDIKKAKDDSSYEFWKNYVIELEKVYK